MARTKTTQTITVSGPTSTIRLDTAPSPGSVTAYRNGQRLTDPDDYAMAGRDATFVAPLQVNERVVLEYEAIP